MTDQTSAEQAASFEDPVARANGLTGAVGYPGDPQTVSGGLSGSGNVSLDALADDALLDLNALTPLAVPAPYRLTADGHWRDLSDEDAPHDAALVAMQDHNARMAFVMRVLTLFAMFPNDCSESLLWRCDGGYAPITFMVNCSDEFAWACADAEPITPADIDALEQAFTDVRAVDPDALYQAPMLFVARKRGMRPQGAAYPTDARLHPLFDACGPERQIDLGNPKRPGGQDGATT